METERLISDLESRYPEGRFVQGVVKLHAPFGFFVDIGEAQADGLVRIIDVKDKDSGRVIPDNDFPPVGTEITAFVWGVSSGVGARPQIILSIQPSLLHGAV